MKKILSFAVLALVSAVVLVGCKKEEPAAPPAPAPTNAAPAAP